MPIWTGFLTSFVKSFGEEFWLVKGKFLIWGTNIYPCASGLPGPPGLPAFYHQNVQYALIQAQNFFNYQIQQTPTVMSSIDQESPG